MQALVTLLVIIVLGGVPSYVIGRRRGVRNAGFAFFPLLGPPVVLLWSIGRSGWMVIPCLIPLVGIWLAFAIPATHGRTRWWGLGLLVPLIGIYTYAFTLARRRTTPGPTTERRDWAWL